MGVASFTEGDTPLMTALRPRFFFFFFWKPPDCGWIVLCSVALASSTTKTLTRATHPPLVGPLGLKVKAPAKPSASRAEVARSGGLHKAIEKMTTHRHGGRTERSAEAV